MKSSPEHFSNLIKVNIDMFCLSKPGEETLHHGHYCQISNIRCTKSKNLNVSHVVL